MSEETPPEAERDPEGGVPEGQEQDGRVTFNLEIVSDNAQAAYGKLRDQVKYWADRGRYNKLRIKRGGKQVVPDIPIGALVAVEAATFFWGGLLRAAVFNVAGRAFFEVELISEAEEAFKEGVDQFLAGDLDDAEKSLHRALSIDKRLARAHLQLGVVHKVKGDRDVAISHFEEAIAFSSDSATRKEAEAHLKRLHGQVAE